MASRPAPQRSSQEMGERFDHLPADAKAVGLLVMGMEGRLTSWNVGAERLFGYEAREIIGKHFSRFFSAEDLGSGRPAVEISTALSGGYAANDGWQVRKDGSRFWCRVTLTSLQDKNGHIQSFVRVMCELKSPDMSFAHENRAAGSAC